MDADEDMNVRSLCLHPLCNAMEKSSFIQPFFATFLA